MTTDGHIAALERRHRELENQLEAELQHKAHDELRISDIKRRKLEVKDKLSRLQGTIAV